MKYFIIYQTLLTVYLYFLLFKHQNLIRYWYDQYQLEAKKECEKCTMQSYRFG